MTITYDDFEKVDARVGKIIKVEDFPEARKPAYKLTIDFGSEIGVKKSSAQITHHYTKDDLAERLVPGLLSNKLPAPKPPFLPRTGLFASQRNFGYALSRITASGQKSSLLASEAYWGAGLTAVVNFAPKQIGPFMSECLTLGFPDAEGNIVLAQPEKLIPLGSRMF